MKIAVISDIHGNIFALNAVLEAIKKQDVTYTICLGDLVGYGCNPNEVIERLRNEKFLVLKGIMMLPLLIRIIRSFVKMK